MRRFIVKVTTTLNVSGNVDTNNPNPMEERAMKETVTSPPQQAEGQEYIIDPEFENLLPDKTPEQYEALKKSIRNEWKVRDPVVVWEEASILLDGHHRDRICKELGITPPIVRMSFASRDDAIAWVLENQLDRRNLKTFQQIEVALKLKEFYTAKAKANQRAGVPLNSAKGIDTNKEVANRADVSADTVRKVERILKRASEPGVAKAIDALRRGARSIDSVYRQYCGKKLELHPYCEFFPMADERLLNDMADSIRRNGLIEPITLYKGKILDGKIRYEACDLAGVEPRYVEYNGDNPYQFVISKNYYRGSLSDEQYAVLTELSEKLKDGGVPMEMINDIAAKWNPPVE
jgi:ParB-like chromosome segregation protein Spo0J